VIRALDVPQLQISFRPLGGGTVVCMVAGLPEGRILPAAFAVKAGTNAFSGTFENITDYSVHLTRGEAYDVALPAVGVRFPYWVTLDGSNEYYMGTGVVSVARVDNVAPEEGEAGGNYTVVVNGAGFMTKGQTQVTFGGLAGAAVSVLDDSALQVRVPAWTGAVPATASVAVYNPDGTWAVGTNVFTYVPEGIGPVGLIGFMFFGVVRKGR